MAPDERGGAAIEQHVARHEHDKWTSSGVARRGAGSLPVRCGRGNESQSVLLVRLLKRIAFHSPLIMNELLSCLSSSYDLYKTGVKLAIHMSGDELVEIDPRKLQWECFRLPPYPVKLFAG